MVLVVEEEHGQAIQELMVVVLEVVEVEMDVTHVVDNIQLKVAILKVLVVEEAETP
jgi:hypothetical protein